MNKKYMLLLLGIIVISIITISVISNISSSNIKSLHLPYCVSSEWHNNTITNICYETQDELFFPQHCLTNTEAICYFMYENKSIPDKNGCAISTNNEDICESR